MIEYRHVASRFFNRPLLLAPETAATLSGFLLSRMSAGPMAGSPAGIDNDAGESVQAFNETPTASGVEFHAPRASRFYGDYPLADDGKPLPFRRTADGTAILTLVGEWVNRGAWIGASSGLISYEGFKYQIQRAAADSKTARIVLDIESPGGEAVGAFEAAAVVRQAATQKPVIAVVNGMAASAAYAIASGANRIVTMPTGLSGSIGVVLMHLDFSQWLADEGIKPTLIFAGDHKVDGNPYEPLHAAVRKDLQAEVSSFYQQFVDTVAVGRKMSADAVRATQARVFKGQEAVDVGLADTVGTFEDVLAEFSPARIGRSQGVAMSDKPQTPATADAGKTFSLADLDHAAKVSAEQAAAQGKADGEKAGATAAKERIKAILSDKNAKGREELANHLAFNTQMPAADAVATLAAAPKAAEPKTSSRLDALMEDEKPAVNAAEGGKSDLAAGLSAAVTGQLAKLGKQPVKH